MSENMSEIQTIKPAFVTYRAGDLRKAFEAQISYHEQQAKKHPIGPEGFHESLKTQNEASLEALTSQTKNDSDILTFPTSLSDFATAVSSSESLASFLDYHKKGRIGVLTLREANHFGLTRSFL